MAVTVKDVAKHAGVSPSTVSRVCNNNPAISKETRDRVLQAIEELGYELSATQETPTARTIKNIGIVLPPSDREAYENSFYLKAIRGISQICNQRQVASTIVTGKDYEEILQSIRTLHRSNSVDGFIMLYSRKDDIVVNYLCEQGLLYVVVGKPDELASQTICIDNDNLLAGREAADYLYNLGHRRIGYIGSINDFMYASDRRAGYQLSLMLHNLPVRQDYCVEMESVNATQSDDLNKMLSMADRPTAFVVSDDMLALALERCCVQMGLSIPNDVSIIAFNNSLYAQLASPQLTAVDINSYQLGQEAAAQIINHAENPNLSATKIVIPHRIVERDSCIRL
ncbi:MAG: LacI family DNA-binding transcriptional regulator [Bacteroidales bacterium]|nr:LacI family DNA-binding transcriptional regulator [Bacteroidales bacterium]MBR5014498.1 LacI family DNA-binding transcriptional regulator [Bacteroidales bacterium]MEE1036052.1 LacI family DNA-binding transcriptional regulator [Oscillospiraceae bacterium]MEE1165482.1 LacI family DNA-binding transcriptional regulator [Lachnospiraceae bacterium]